MTDATTIVARPEVFRALAIRQGLKLYAKTGMKPNSAWTPMRMLKAAEGITGKSYHKGDYLKAAEDIATALSISEHQGSSHD